MIRRLPYRSFATHARPSNNPFPFPSHSNPSPHQIFHLPRNATQEQVKHRYYELVRIYHPDKTDSSIPPHQAHSRFQSISNAYNTLRGKPSSPSNSADPDSQAYRDPNYATTAARRAMHLRRHRELYEGGAVDDRWKDRIIIFGIVTAVAVFVAQTALTRNEALEEVLYRSRQIQLDRADTLRRRKQTVEDPRLAAPDQKDSDT
ncbi:hypothetical protein K435DRAFT_848877 [Dendrothele bispora CBS 962.96]|uniref:J domain-containing protein n=1 Tax=Dendrothele bispora (strain CBS 962.96) TaxID=1314807 RepID=A0A4S8MUR9_DENBC|nr:hypothetical protein K435DRAFT_867037 [Dendrothele bispora CBS 962.96]THV06812.1 hypothetical protein K435DRAFT_848877 [Dendrothele bispora CBS 962.96]